ncbi:acetate--CoA ligase [Oxalobacter aliiformigenes]|uniref:Acetyl-coenzyme A synthetase n=1 Tax=Oxalobacter aliiformigenes TaxID=2946593 RepID=A0A9E9LDH9_9BURK|nr:acetate--CoA ligase [Oxalobacter aliiformigenes]WAV90927.1 acetate--CoA ligase [Oxalobacter aliiformigenes]
MAANPSEKKETQFYYPSEAFVQNAAISGMDAYHALCRAAAEDYEGFWAELAQENVLWHKPFTRVLNETNPPFYKWFEDGELNVSWNCLDKNLDNGNAEKDAIIFEADDGTVTKVTYRELHRRVCKLANGLKSLGVRKGDRVVIYMAMSIEAVVAMQACARIGAIHSVVFGGFSAPSLGERIENAGAVAVITADMQIRGGRRLPLKAIVDDALAMSESHTVKNVIVYQRTDEEIPFDRERDHWMHELTRSQSEICQPEWVNAEHPLFILYTSGSTGNPKGAQHSSGGYLLWAIMTMRWTFDIKPTDIFWCTADIGWITGHTYNAYGPLAVGATIVLFEGVPTYPHAGRFWEMIEKHKVSIFYTAPTAVRSLIKASSENRQFAPEQYDLSSLRLLGSVGEPINPEAWLWFYKHIGKERCPIVDTFWQTETGGHVIAPMPGATPLVPGSCTLPLPGLSVSVVDETGQELPWGQGGILVINRPWPSMIRTVWGNDERYKTHYWPEELGGKLYQAGDGAIRDPETGYFTITGRIDDVLNVSGHALGTMEVESVLAAHPMVAEAAVVGKPDDLTGESICAFVILKDELPQGDQAKSIASDLREWVSKEISPIARPKEIRFGENLPKTRSGKIMRRLLRVIARGEEITQDISTLENPAILDQLRNSL